MGSQNMSPSSVMAEFWRERRSSKEKPAPCFAAGQLSIETGSFQLAWFTHTMATGGLALLQSPQVQPQSFHGLETIGKIFYIYDITALIAISLAITYRFIKHPGTLERSLIGLKLDEFYETAQLSRLQE